MSKQVWNLNDIPAGSSLSFMGTAVLRTCLIAEKLDWTEEEFINFVKGIWETMEMNDRKELHSALQERMHKDIEALNP